MEYLRGYGERGVTLLELLIGVAILAILIGLGIPNLRLFRERARIKGAVNTLLSDIHLARMRAMETGYVAVFFEPEENRYSISLWEDSNGNTEIEESELTLLKTVNLPQGIQFGTSEEVEIACSGDVEGEPPDDGVAFEYEDNDNILLFNKRGYPVSKEGVRGGALYIHNNRQTYAISVSSGGLTKKCVWDGESWHE
jgi:type IV fimbrial biogenesis protein FimT